MTTHMTNLHYAIEGTLAGKRLGTPVFVRYLFQTQDKASAVPARLAQVVSTIRGWVKQAVERIHALGQVKQQHVSLTIEFRNGATAVVGWSPGTPTDDGVDVMVLGSHGALYHDFGTAASWDAPQRGTGQKPDAVLLQLIEDALAAGQ